MAKLNLPKSKSRVKNNYLVTTEQGQILICKYNYKAKQFTRQVTVSSFGQGSWTETEDIDDAISWVCINDLDFNVVKE